MFLYPKGTLHISVLSAAGKTIWTKDLGRGVVPGMWFCPVLPFDSNGDGTDEIYFVNNIDTDHPLSLNGLRIEKLDGRTGKTLGQYPWPKQAVQTMSYTYRHFLMGAMANSTPVGDGAGDV